MIPALRVDDQTYTNGKALTVDLQKGVPCLWAMVDSDAAKVPRRVHMCGTGDICEHDLSKYVGTIQLAAGELILHVFVD
jgi:hypothetical protein